MGYIGKKPATQGKDAGPALKLDDISGDFDGLTSTFSLSVDGTSISPHVNNISVYLSGVYQIPGNSYSLSGSYIVFTGAPSASLDFHGAIIGASRIFLPDNATVETSAFTTDTITSISGSRDAVSISGSRDAASISGSFGNQRVGTTDNVQFNHITASGNISASGTVFADNFQSLGGDDTISFADDLNITGSISVSNDLTVGQYIYHGGDSDTYIRFAPNLVNLVAGGKSAIKYEASTGKIIINNTNENVDFHVMAEDNLELLVTDAANNRVGVNTTTPQTALTVSGSISGSGDLNIGGNITGSVVSASTGKFTTVDIDGGTITGITDLTVADGGTGVSTLTDGGVLLGSGTSAITAMAVLTDGQMIVGDGTTDPVAESGATLRTSIGVGATDDVKFANITGSGNISGSYLGTGSFGRLEVADNAVIADTMSADYMVSTYQLTVNESGHGGGDFRVESADNVYMLFSDANTNSISIGANASAGGSTLGVTGDITVTSHITASGAISASGNLSATGNLDIDGTSNFAGNVTLQNDLTVTGRIDAEEIHTTFISSSIAQATGSTIFGDATTDSHHFTGSVDVSGSLRVSDGNVVVSDTLTATNIGAFTAAGAIDFDSQNMTNVDIDSGTINGITDLAVADGGTGVSTLTDGGVLLGSGTSAITAMAVLTDGQMIVGDGSTDPVAESGATLRTSIGVGTTDDVKFANITGSNDISASGDVSATNLYGQVATAAQTNITSLLATDIKIGEDDQTKIDFETANEIHFYADNAQRLNLDANSRISLSNNDGGSQNTVFGHLAGAALASSVDNNVLIGYQAGTALNGGDQNVIVGHLAGDALTSGEDNTFIGQAAGGATTAGSSIVVVGRNAGLGNMTTAANGTVIVGAGAGAALTSGEKNVAIGYQALDADTTGDNSVAVGYQALTAQTGVDGEYSNTAVGTQAGKAITTGRYSTAIGFQALQAEDVGDWSTAVGYAALYAQNSDSNQEDTGNTGLGAYTGLYNVTGQNNTYVGYQAGTGASGQSNSDNTAVGKDALLSVTTGGQNVAIGKQAADSITDGAENVIIGDGAAQTTTSVSNAVIIGRGAAQNGNITTAANGTVAVGYKSQEALTTGAGNVAVGFGTLEENTTGARNIAIGSGSLHETGTNRSDDNVAIGLESMGGEFQANNSANVAIGNLTMQGNLDAVHYSVAIGYSALNKITTGDKNIAIGGTALSSADGAEHNNIAIGYDAMASANHESTHGNVAIGYNALKSTAANGHPGTIAIGYNALEDCTSGNGNIAIGYLAAANTVAGAKNVAIGYNAMETANNSNANGNVVIGYQAAVALEDGSDNTIIGRSANVSGKSDVGSIYIGSGSVTSAPNDGATHEYVLGAGTGAGDSTFRIFAAANNAHIAINGSATSFSASSDKKLKFNINNSNVGLGFINDLRPITFNWKESTGRGDGTINYGFVAQEVKQVIDNHNVEDGQDIWSVDPEGIQCLSPPAFIPMMVKALQELSQQVEDLKKEIVELKE